MKTKLLTSLLICFFATLFTAQTLVKPADYKLSSTAVLLKGKGYDILEQTETYIKLTNKSKGILYLDLDASKKYILLNVNISLKDGVTRDKIDNLLEEINKLGMIKAEYIENQNSIGFRYYFWITGGFTNETLEDAVAEFYLYQGDAYALDKENMISYQK
ncbi:hypothetical protein SAMN05421664_1673 [Chryseobacterium soldanellicola]|uniref:Sensory transduction regulator n=1 Tax=Chryseobacterium soldanellicola TaxID=311333 RepID=A0A1H1B1B8_9FLAO|nr:hypothetical protein [Chryseobacterium soldanellicola]SDQ45703.1 hypothetical protein SAMN05421664_1673 [Chryseobacterium soldanellicola]